MSFFKHSFFFLEKKQNKIYQLCVLVLANNSNVEPDLKQHYAKMYVLKLMVIIIDYLETKLLQCKYATIDSKSHRLPFPIIIITHHKHNLQ